MRERELWTLSSSYGILVMLELFLRRITLEGFMTSGSQKTLPLLLALAVSIVSRPAAIFSVQTYRHPRESMNSVLRATLLFAGIQEGTFDLSGTAMHYYFAGRRDVSTPVVLVHGLGSSAEGWTLLLSRLSKELLVYAPDMPGFGKTPLVPEGYNIRAHVLYLERFLNAIGHPRVILVGNSLGGWIATRFAVEYPERVEHLYLLNSAGLTRENMDPPYASDRASARKILRNILGYSFPLPSFVLDEVVRTSQTPAFKGFIESYDPHEELDSVLAQVLTPTTIIWGIEDRIFPIICAHDLHIGISNSKLVLLPRVGHVPHVQASAKVAHIILEDGGRKR